MIIFVGASPSLAVPKFTVISGGGKFMFHSPDVLDSDDVKLLAVPHKFLGVVFPEENAVAYIHEIPERKIVVPEDHKVADGDYLAFVGLLAEFVWQAELGLLLVLDTADEHTVKDGLERFVQIIT
jgi:hypothetical protein